MNVAPYIGIPYRDHGRSHGGVDCWGLVDLFYREQFAVVLPDYDSLYRSADDVGGTAAALGLVALASPAHSHWTPVQREDWRAGDVILFRVGRHVCHVGLAFGPDFLHCLRGRNSVLERLDSATWAGAIKGGFRWTGN